MPRPSKSADATTGHRTKKELTPRKKEEEALKSPHKISMSESVKNDPIAVRYFLQVVDQLDAIDINEAFFENVINRYCLLLAEHDRLVEVYRRLLVTADEETIKEVNAMGRNINTIRNQLLAIEKENLLTMQSKLRAIPKTQEEMEVSPLERFKQKYSS